MQANEIAIRLEQARQDQLAAFADMERSPHATGFVGNYLLERHLQEFNNPAVRYLSIYDDQDSLVGFIILVLDPDTISLEFRRIVVTRPGIGIGSYVMSQLPPLCREMGRRRIWLDVYENNERARGVYENAGFTRFGSTLRGNRTLLLYERVLTAE